MTDAISLAVHGAAGRMGQRVLALAHKDPQFRILAALESATSPHLGRDAGELAGIGRIDVPLRATLDERVDVVIDFSVPAAVVPLAQMCGERQIPLVVATTGFSPAQRTDVLAASQTTALLVAPSMSLAVNVAMRLVQEAGRLLKQVPQGVDVEIVERHHRFKEDAPSGTALRFGELVAEVMGQTEHVHGRHGRPGQRPRQEIGYHALRVGDNVGEHQIIFGMLGETLEISVKTSTRDSYAYGALLAAKFLFKQKPGLYSIQDVLGL